MAMRLGQVVHIHPRHQYPEGQPMIMCVGSQWHAHAIMAIFGHHEKTLATLIQMSSKCTKTFIRPILRYGEFW
jgi:hypothetical protein